MNLKDQIEQIKEFIVNFSIDVNTDDVPALVSVDLGDQAPDDTLMNILGVGIAYAGILLPIIIVFIVIYFSAKMQGFN